MSEDRILSSRLRDALPLFTAVAMALLALVVVAILYAGRDVFIPLAVAVVLSFVLAPVVRLLQRVHVPRGIAVAAVVLAGATLMAGIGMLMAAQVAQLAADLPRYQSTMRDKIQSLRGAPGEVGTFGRAADILKDLGKELEQSRSSNPRASDNARPGRTGSPDPAGGPAPTPVEVHQPAAGPLETIASLVTPLLHPLASAGLTVIFVIFMLLQREDLRNRFIRIAGTPDLQRTTAAIDDAAHRLSRFFLTQLAINTGFGIIIALGLWAIGIPSPALWGFLAGLLRFLPYIGAFIGAAFPLAVAAAVDPGWSMFVLTAVLFVTVEPLLGHVIEPLLYGHSTGLSPIAVVLSATFWTVLWGPIGLILAAPITVCLVVLGRHTQRLQFIDVLLGDRPALSPPQIFYQRMLAGDPTEAVAQADEFLKERSILTYYDEVALEGLRLAHEDTGRGALKPERQATMRLALRELVAELRQKHMSPSASSRYATDDPEAAAAIAAAGPDPAFARSRLTPDELRPEWRGEGPVLSIAGRDGLDEGPALMLGHLLETYGIQARELGPESLTPDNLPRLETRDLALVCLSFMSAPSTVHIRYAVRLVRRRFPHVRVMVCIWRDRDPATLENLRRQTSADYLVTSLAQAVAAILAAARGADGPNAVSKFDPPEARRAAAHVS